MLAKLPPGDWMPQALERRTPMVVRSAIAVRRTGPELRMQTAENVHTKPISGPPARPHFAP